MKKSKNEKCIFGPPKDFFIQNLWKKLCSTQKVCLIKVPSEYRKKGQGKKFRGPKMKFSLLGDSNFSPWAFFLYSDDTFIGQTFWVEQSFFHKFCMKKSFWGSKMHLKFFDFFIKFPLYFMTFPLCCPVYKEV